MSEKNNRRKGRGQVSSIDRLPADLKIRLDDALRDKSLTQREIVDQLNELLDDRGLDRLSKSAVNRYALNIEEQAAQLRQAREAAEAIVGRLEHDPKGDVGRATTEIIKSLVFDFTLKSHQDAVDADQPIDIGTLGDIALTIQRLERAAKTGADREMKIRQQLMEEQRQKMEEAIDRGDIMEEAGREALRLMGMSE